MFTILGCGLLTNRGLASFPTVSAVPWTMPKPAQPALGEGGGWRRRATSKRDNWSAGRSRLSTGLGTSKICHLQNLQERLRWGKGWDKRKTRHQRAKTWRGRSTVSQKSDSRRVCGIFQEGAVQQHQIFQITRIEKRHKSDSKKVTGDLKGVSKEVAVRLRRVNEWMSRGKLARKLAAEGGRGGAPRGSSEGGRDPPVFHTMTQSYPVTALSKASRSPLSPPVFWQGPARPGACPPTQPAPLSSAPAAVLVPPQILCACLFPLVGKPFHPVGLVNPFILPIFNV